MEDKKMFSLILQSDNERLNKAYQAYLDAKEELQRVLYYEGIVVETKKDTASGNWRQDKITYSARYSMIAFLKLSRARAVSSLNFSRSRLSTWALWEALLETLVYLSCWAMLDSFLSNRFKSFKNTTSLLPQFTK